MILINFIKAYSLNKTFATTELLMQNVSDDTEDVTKASDNDFTGQHPFSINPTGVRATKGTSDKQYTITEFVQQNSGSGGNTIPAGAIFPFAMTHYLQVTLLAMALLFL